MKLQRSVETNAAPAAIFAYLSDFTNTNEWDPGTVQTVRVSGDGGIGTTYRNTSKFMGRETELTYEVIRHQPDTVFASRVTYTADFEFKGLGKLIAPLLKPALKKLGDEAEEGLRDALEKL
jgi:hypothetical protein